MQHMAKQIKGSFNYLNWNSSYQHPTFLNLS